ncbi:unnamed protein product [Allacma fusca]|uniref:Uncharacterized protein n=1 Tax=Allacma fusca TaxID=39272 RepID=A0A8J2K0I9_9HEXA|nr:unnamed protein product [Allacma fusca]
MILPTSTNIENIQKPGSSGSGATLDTLYSNSFETIVHNGRLSEHIMQALIYSTYVFSDALIRFTNIYHSCTIIELTSSLKVLMKKYVPNAQGNMIVIMFIASLLSAGFIKAWTDILIHDLNYDFTSYNFTLTFLPVNNMVLAGVYCFTDTGTYTSLIFSYAFIVGYGLIILGIYGKYIAKFVRTFITPAKGFGKEYRLTFPTLIEDFGRDAEILKQCMDKYSKIAGVYTLAILYVSTVNVIRYLNHMTTADTLEFVSNSWIFNASCFVAVVFLSNFGNYLQIRVDF